jgi:nucleotide-binding universal stress UspA family protein
VLERDAKEFLERELESLRGEGEGLDVESRVVEGTPPDALFDAATGADLLVVGTRGHGRLSGLLLGSVSQKLAHHAPCPLVLVPHQ